MNDINETLEDVIAYGPNRVLVGAEGETASYRDAIMTLHIKPVVVLVRDDGWTLGAPADLEDVARKMWETRWVGVIRKDINGTYRLDS